jgi:hypothetical protein
MMLRPGVILSICLAAVFLFVIQDATWSERPNDPGLGAEQLGTALLTTWVVPFEIASVLLTAALVGAIMLARSPQEEAEDALAVEHRHRTLLTAGALPSVSPRHRSERATRSAS